MITHFLYESNQSGSTVNSILNYQPTLHFCSTNRYHRSMGYSTKDIFSESKLYAFRSKDIAQGFEMMKEEDSELNSSHGHKKIQLFTEKLLMRMTCKLAEKTL